MKKSRRSKRHSATQRYESPGETDAAVGRIRAQFKHTKVSLAKEKEFDSSPEGVLKTTLQALLDARKAITVARKELDAAIVALRRKLPRK